MSANGPPDCHLCERPVVKGSEVLLNKKLFHPGCAVVVAKEKKNGRDTDDARRGSEGDEAGIVSCADPARN
jgi:hypothetical protein